MIFSECFSQLNSLDYEIFLFLLNYLPKFIYNSNSNEISLILRILLTNFHYSSSSGNKKIFHEGRIQMNFIDFLPIANLLDSLEIPESELFFVF